MIRKCTGPPVPYEQHAKERLSATTEQARWPPHAFHTHGLKPRKPVKRWIAGVLAGAFVAATAAIAAGVRKAADFKQAWRPGRGRSAVDVLRDVPT